MSLSAPGKLIYSSKTFILLVKYLLVLCMFYYINIQSVTSSKQSELHSTADFIGKPQVMYQSISFTLLKVLNKSLLNFHTFMLYFRIFTF